MGTAHIDATYTDDDGRSFRVTGDLTVSPVDDAAAPTPDAAQPDAGQPDAGQPVDAPAPDAAQPAATDPALPVDTTTAPTDTTPGETVTDPAFPATDTPTDQPADPGQTDTGRPDPEANPEQPADPTTAGTEAGAPATPDAPGGTGGDVPAWPGRELRRDDRQHTPDADVRTWQQAATDHGFTVGPVDGFFGPRTEGGVVAVQRAALIDVTGVIDERTWAAAWTA